MGQKEHLKVPLLPVCATSILLPDHRPPPEPVALPHPGHIERAVRSTDPVYLCSPVWLCEPHIWSVPLASSALSALLPAQGPFHINRRKTKRWWQEGDGKKMSQHFATNVTTIYNILWQLATTLWQFMTFSVPSPSSRPLLDFAGSKSYDTGNRSVLLNCSVWLSVPIRKQFFLRKQHLQRPHCSELPLGPKLLHYITLLFRINFPDYVIIFYITELVSNYFLGYVISCVVAEHTMWASDYIT